MIRGTTPTFTFELPFDASLLKDARIIFAQCGKKIFSKAMDLCQIEERSIAVTLTQEETLSFNSGTCLQAQLKVLTHAGKVLMSDIFQIDCDECLCEEVLE